MVFGLLSGILGGGGAGGAGGGGLMGMFGGGQKGDSSNTSKAKNQRLIDSIGRASSAQRNAFEGGVHGFLTGLRRQEFEQNNEVLDTFRKVRGQTFLSRGRR